MRLEANISLADVSSMNVQASELPDYKVELKNINSFKFLEKAMNAEIERQKQILDSGKKIAQETRGFDEKRNETFSQRIKEESNDYRYFPEPDIPPFEFDELFIDDLKKDLPELPKEKRGRFKKEYSLPDNYIEFLVSSIKLSEYFEEAIKVTEKYQISYKMLADLIVNRKLYEEYPEPAGLVKKILELSKKEFSPVSEVEKAVEEVIREEKKAADDYRKGKGAVIGFLIGLVQKKLKGKGDPRTIGKSLIAKLDEK
jgi:aspartyl-tRNA(Asn)/glutamyl-tRNA(Gln) amidotransferase subunit B